MKLNYFLRASVFFFFFFIFNIKYSSPLKPTIAVFFCKIRYLLCQLYYFLQLKTDFFTKTEHVLFSGKTRSGKIVVS